MNSLHLHLLSDSTGETLETIAKAALAQFSGVAVTKHFWPMVRSEAHLDRIMPDIANHPGLVIFTLVNSDMRDALEERCRLLDMPSVAAIDPVTDALSLLLGQQARGRPGHQHKLDAAYFRKVDAIQYTMAHDDGLGADQWEQADLLLAGVSRTSKTPTSMYLANRGFKTANVPIVMGSPLPTSLFGLHHPMIIGLIAGVERLVQIRRNRLLSLNQAPDTDYVDLNTVTAEMAYAKRIFADRGWPVIDVTRRSIEETAAAIIGKYQEWLLAQGRSVAGEERLWS